jgi:hypothetical protein
VKGALVQGWESTKLSHASTTTNGRRSDKVQQERGRGECSGMQHRRGNRVGGCPARDVPMTIEALMGVETTSWDECGRRRRDVETERVRNGCCRLGKPNPG